MMEALKSQATANDNPTDLITNNIDIWTSAIKTRSSAGRGSSKKLDLYGIKKLRELILELAVQGKLVPQDPNDEPASVLLERIAAEKDQQIKDKKLKKQRALPPIDEDEKTFNLPAGWEWIRLGELFNSIMSGGTPSKREHSFWAGDIPWASVKDLGKERYITKTEDYITQSGLEAGSKLADIGDVLICTRMGLGKVGVANVPLAFNQDLKSVKLSSLVDVEHFLNTYSTIKIKGTGTTVAGIKQEQLLGYVVGLPPLAEQHRIVAKVDELMALCDQLEQQTEASIDAHATLVETLLTTLTNSPDAAELEQNWTRIADHFDTLFTTEHSIDQLKQTVLQLAVMGKLVPQDPNDEPAAVLLEKIAAEKEQLVKEKKIKKQKLLPPIDEDEKPFALPEGWEWSRLGEAILLKNGYAFKSKHFVNEPTPFVLTTPGNFFETGGFRSRGDKTRFYDGDVAADFIFQTGDLIIPMTEQAPGLLGSSAFIPDDGKIYVHNQRLGKLTQYCNKSTSLEFIALFFNTPYLRGELAKSCTGTTVRHTSPDRIYNVLFPILPLAEQHRIVAKADQLMSLCDQLKARLQQAQQTQLHLADALVEQAVE